MITRLFSHLRNRRIFGAGVIGFLIGIYLLGTSGCSVLADIPFLRVGPASPTPTQTVVVKPSLTPVPQKTVNPTSKPQSNDVFTIWVPPEFDPSEQSKAATVLADRLQSFFVMYPGIRFEVRVKAVDGDASLLDSMVITKEAAPDAMPSLVLLSRQDLEIAANKSLIYPIDKLTKIMNESDWYAYTQQMSRVQNDLYGIPFASNGLALFYRPDKVNTTSIDWNIFFNPQMPAVFPAADQKSLAVIALYQSLGGEVINEQGQPMLDPEILTQVLQFILLGNQKGSFPAWMTELQDDEQAWESYAQGRSVALISWTTYFFAQKTSTAGISLLPPVSGTSDYSMFNGWLWAISDLSQDRRELAARLIEHLSDPAFLAEWTVESGYIPPRPSALDLWKESFAKPILSKLSLSATVIPSQDVVDVIGPILNTAVSQVILKGSDPEKVAFDAAKQLLTPEKK